MKAGLILFNGNFQTQDSVKPWVRAIAIDEGRILAVGENDEIRSLARPGTEVIDLGGRLGLPGLTDSHIHFVRWALRRRQLALADAVSMNEVLERIAKKAHEVVPGAWIQGWGLDADHWPEGRLPVREDLDIVASKHPVLLFQRDSHLAIANSRALEMAGVTVNTADPSGGALKRDESGRPTGVLIEGAMYLVTSLLPNPSEYEIVDAMCDAMPIIHRLGLTGIHDMRIWDKADGRIAFAAWQRFKNTGKMDLRCWMNLAGDHLDEAISLGLKTGFGNDLLRIGHLKYFTDGSVRSRTAWVLEPYDTGGCGMPVCSMADLAEALSRADQFGLSVAVHAIGDMANRELTTIFEDIKRRRETVQRDKTNRLKAPNRIEHAQILHSDDLPRLAQLGLFASVMPIHITDEITMHDQRIGHRAEWAYRFRDIIDAGIMVIFGSDSPAADPNPLWGIHSAVTRRRRDGTPEEGWYPGQKVTVSEAVWSYTLGPAMACGREHELGSITQGKLADLVVLDRDLYSIDPMAIHEVQVDLTIFDGRVVYKR